MSYFTFGSMSAISKYEPEELLLNGLDTVWIGVESYFTRLKKTRAENQQEQFDLNERGAFTAETFRTLHSMGIKTIGSWIMGLDCQDRINVPLDEDHFISLNPTFQQISVLTVEPAMPIGKRYESGKPEAANTPGGTIICTARLLSRPNSRSASFSAASTRCTGECTSPSAPRCCGCWSAISTAICIAATRSIRCYAGRRPPSSAQDTRAGGHASGHRGIRSERRDSRAWRTTSADR